MLKDWEPTATFIGIVLTYLLCLNCINFKGITYMCYTYSELVTHFKCKYFDCLFVIFALPYPLLLYTVLCLFSVLLMLCYAIFDMFYILLGDDPMLYGSIEQ